MRDVSHLAMALAGAWATLAVGMAALWALHLRLRNAAIVDVGWAVGLPVAAALYAHWLDGDARDWILVALATVWGTRLAVHLLLARVIGHVEEGRYAALRRGWRTNVPLKFFMFFQAQALLDVILSVPFLIVAADPHPPGTIEVFAIGLWVVAFLGESLADYQLERFRRSSDSARRVCDVGLWRFSRHPNYFFEWLIWVAYALYASGSVFGWAAWLSPALILWFLFRVTGIPATEAQALRSRGDAYRRYQERTSAFVPWPPRSA